MFGTEDGLGEITYTIRDEGSNTTLIKESLVNKLRLKGHPVDFRLTMTNKVSGIRQVSFPLRARPWTEGVSRDSKCAVCQ